MDTNAIAGIIAGFKAGIISEREASKLLYELGVDNTLLNTALSLGVGALVGGAVANTVSDLLGDLF